jgi:Fe-S-cluster-containing dehydrogenase component
MENLLPPGSHRTWVIDRAGLEWEIGICRQCEHPACVVACDHAATWKNAQGVVVVGQDRCVGCRRCVEACPYDARALNTRGAYFAEPSPYEVASRAANEVHRSHEAGKADKCDFCLHRIARNALPMCVEACPTGCRIFGDLDDPYSEVFQSITNDERACRSDLGTHPKVFHR